MINLLFSFLHAKKFLYEPIKYPIISYIYNTLLYLTYNQVQSCFTKLYRQFSYNPPKLSPFLARKSRQIPTQTSKKFLPHTQIQPTTRISITYSHAEPRLHSILYPRAQAHSATSLPLATPALTHLPLLLALTGCERRARCLRGSSSLSLSLSPWLQMDCLSA